MQLLSIQFLLWLLTVGVISITICTWSITHPGWWYSTPSYPATQQSAPSRPSSHPAIQHSPEMTLVVPATPPQPPQCQATGRRNPTPYTTPRTRHHTLDLSSRLHFCWWNPEMSTIPHHTSNEFRIYWQKFERLFNDKFRFVNKKVNVTIAVSASQFVCLPVLHTRHQPTLQQFI